ncbi:MAG: 50S ribosomal protein L20 [Spirochaetales bacterium]|nr:50S ribosomal protein L20 [Spirochaetales bacterium]
MPRAIDGTRRSKRRRKILKRAKGFWGRRKSNFKTAKEAVIRAYVNAYKGRKLRRRDMRNLWIARISAFCRQNGIMYSRFINGLKKANIIINRKALSNMAIEDPNGFLALVEQVKKHLEPAEK